MPASAAVARRSTLITGLLLGIGLAGTLDQVVLHELLQWHNFYVNTSPHWRLFIDGIFHAVSSGLLLAGVLRLWADRKLLTVASGGRVLLAATLFGMGGFNLYDGVVDHKVLQLHPVREGVADLLPYDAGFIGLALLLLLAGLFVWRRPIRLAAHEGTVMTAIAQGEKVE